MLEVNDMVRKKHGYNFPGIVVSVFQKLDGQTRVVVECTAPGVEGMLHIFSESNLEKVIQDFSDT